MEWTQEHQRRKTALDQLSDKYSETQSKLDKSERTILSLNENIAKLVSPAHRHPSYPSQL